MRGDLTNNVVFLFCFWLSPCVDDEGIMVMCETCQVWQHCSCVGLGEGKATPELYYCELCQPQLHPFSVRDGVVYVF